MTPDDDRASGEDDGDEPDNEPDDEPTAEDPIEDFADATEDREGDPFEYLSDPEGDVGAGSTPEPPEDDPLDDVGESDIEDEPALGAEGSLREVAEPSVGPEDPGPGDPFDAEEGVFEEMDVGDRDIDAVWEDLADAEARGSVAEAAERTYAEVSKHSFCEGCEYFSGPPEVSCSHEGTEILRFVDMETVRVVDCPVVEERRQLEREG